MFYFLLLSLLSGILELGAVYIGIIEGFPIVLVMILPFFYQLGNLLMNYLPLKKGVIILLGFAVILLSFFHLNNWCYPAFAVQLVFCSFCIQAGRGLHKKTCPAWLKRSFRIMGFAASPLILFANGQPILLISLLLSIFPLITSTQKFNSFDKPSKHVNEISLVMIFHQIHYFVYTYIMPIWVYKMTNQVYLSAIAFAITWIVYLMPQTIAEKYRKVRYKTVFFLCHTFLAGCLGCMAIFAEYHQPYIVLGLWLLTGLGGGSVFCIRHLSARYENINMDLSENIGHVLGPVLAVLIAVIWPGNEFPILLIASCLSVLLAILFALFIQVKEIRQ